MAHKMSILVIDDSKLNCDQLIDAFAKYRHILDLTIANNRELALRHITQLRRGYDLIILDACLTPPGLVLDTLDLIHLLFDSSEVDAYTGLLVGSTGIKQYQDAMKKAGCHHTFSKEKILANIDDLLSLAKEKQLLEEIDRRSKR